MHAHMHVHTHWYIGPWTYSFPILGELLKLCLKLISGNYYFLPQKEAFFVCFQLVGILLEGI